MENDGEPWEQQSNILKEPGQEGGGQSRGLETLLYEGSGVMDPVSSGITPTAITSRHCSPKATLPGSS